VVVRVVLASGLWVTAVLSASVFIIAGQWGSAGAFAVDTFVGCGAGIAIIARFGVGGEHTSLGTVAAVICAPIVVIAKRGLPAHTAAIGTAVLRGAGIRIVTRVLIGCVLTSQGALAAVIRAWVVVFTVR